jgi:hypothetical protein
MKLCVPAVVNLFFLTVFVLQSVMKYDFSHEFLLNVLISLAITYAINKLCMTGHPYLAWGLLFLPLILTFLLLVILLKSSTTEPFSMVNYKCLDYPMIYCNLKKGCGCGN